MGDIDMKWITAARQVAKDDDAVTVAAVVAARFGWSLQRALDVVESRIEPGFTCTQ